MKLSVVGEMYRMLPEDSHPCQYYPSSLHKMIFAKASRFHGTNGHCRSTGRAGTIDPVTWMVSIVYDLTLPAQMKQDRPSI